MDKTKSKYQEAFFAKFMKFTVIATVLIIIDAFFPVVRFLVADNFAFFALLKKYLTFFL